MKRCGPLLVLAWLSSACGSERSDSAANPPSKAGAEQASKAEPAPPRDGNEGKAAEPVPARPEPGPPAAGKRWRTTVEDAKAAGLPPLAFSFDITGTGMAGGPGDGHYVTLSGPPGGPLMLRISPATVGADPATLVRRDASPVTAQEVELFEAKQRAVAWITGEGMGRTSWCGIVVAPPGATEGAAALLVELGVGHQGEDVTCKTTVEDDVLGPIVKSLVFE